MKFFSLEHLVVLIAVYTCFVFGRNVGEEIRVFDALLMYGVALANLRISIISKEMAELKDALIRPNEVIGSYAATVTNISKGSK